MQLVCTVCNQYYLHLVLGCLSNASVYWITEVYYNLSLCVLTIIKGDFNDFQLASCDCVELPTTFPVWKLLQMTSSGDVACCDWFAQMQRKATCRWRSQAKKATCPSDQVSPVGPYSTPHCTLHTLHNCLCVWAKIFNSYSVEWPVQIFYCQQVLQ